MPPSISWFKTSRCGYVYNTRSEILRRWNCPPFELYVTTHGRTWSIIDGHVKTLHNVIYSFTRTNKYQLSQYCLTIVWHTLHIRVVFLLFVYHYFFHNVGRCEACAVSPFGKRRRRQIDDQHSIGSRSKGIRFSSEYWDFSRGGMTQEISGSIVALSDNILIKWGFFYYCLL